MHGAINKAIFLELTNVNILLLVDLLADSSLELAETIVLEI